MLRRAGQFRAKLVAPVSVSLLLLALTTLLPAAANAQAWGPTNLSNSGGAQSPQVAIDRTGKNISVVWEDKSPGNSGVLYSGSSDAGLTFSAPKNLSQSGSSSDPGLAVDAAGNINVVWRENNTRNYDLYYARSTDGGARFTSPKKISNMVSVYDPHLVIDSKGNIGVVYVDSDYTSDPVTSIVVLESKDGGLTFSSRTLASGAYPFVGRPQVAIDSQDAWHLIWVADADGNMNMYYSRSADGGANFSSPVWIARGDVGRAQIAVAPNGTIAVIWFDNGSSDYVADAGLYLTRSSDGGLNWQLSPEILSHSAPAWGRVDSITTDHAGNFAAVWVEDGNVNFAGGPDFSGRSNISASFTADRAMVATDSIGAINVVWSEGWPQHLQVCNSNLRCGRGHDSGARRRLNICRLGR